MISSAIATYLSNQSLGTLGTDLFVRIMPELPDNCIKACIGGEFNFDKMMDIEKNIVKEITGIKENCSKISQKEIDRFASEINERITGNR